MKLKTEGTGPDEVLTKVKITLKTRDKRKVVVKEIGSVEILDGGCESDADCDGLLNHEEANGTLIVIDVLGFGAGDIDQLEERFVTSDPFLADTDGDGLTDAEEVAFRSDPRSDDTDADGLTDDVEVRQWESDPTSADSDNDARGPTDNDCARSGLPLPPRAVLLDGNEVAAGTSPTLCDTDGDGKSDFEEDAEPDRDPRLAEIPKAALDITGDIDIRLFKTESGSNTETLASETTTTDTQRTTRSDTESTAITTGASSGGEGIFDELLGGGAKGFVVGKALELGRSTACDLTGGGQQFIPEWESDGDPDVFQQIVNGFGDGLNSVFGTATGATGACDAATPETTTTSSVTVSSEEANTFTQAFSESRTVEEGFSISRGEIKIAAAVRNAGISTVDVEDVRVTLLQWSASPRPTAHPGAGAFRALATLVPAAPPLNLPARAPGSVSGPLEFEDVDVNPEIIRELWRRPQAIFFSPTMTLRDQDGVDTNFLTEETYRRTALLVLETPFTVKRYQIATNVERVPDAIDQTTDDKFAGISMQTIFDTILDEQYETMPVQRDVEGVPVIVDALHQMTVGGQTFVNSVPANRGDPVNGISGDPAAAWVMFGNREDQLRRDLPFDDVRLFPQDELRIVYLTDSDGDGVFGQEEALYGCFDNGPDCDSDGLTDYLETKIGWTVEICYAGCGGVSPATVSYRVTSDPGRADTDNDGLTDIVEMALGTDPSDVDTDDDCISDFNEPTEDALIPLANNCLPRIGFITSALYQGDIGSDNMLVEADGKCQALAVSAGLPGNYFAWLSTGGGGGVLINAGDRLGSSQRPFTRVDGAVIADSKDDLLTAGPMNQIIIDEAGANRDFSTVWTATDASGQFIPTDLSHCASFTSNTGTLRGANVGFAASDNSSIDWWTDVSSVQNCDVFNRMYCFTLDP